MVCGSLTTLTTKVTKEAQRAQKTCELGVNLSELSVKKLVL